MRPSRCWWGCSSNFDKIGKTQHFSTFIDIYRCVEVAAGGDLTEDLREDTPLGSLLLSSEKIITAEEQEMGEEFDEMEFLW